MVAVGVLCGEGVVADGVLPAMGVPLAGDAPLLLEPSAVGVGAAEEGGVGREMN